MIQPTPSLPDGGINLRPAEPGPDLVIQWGRDLRYPWLRVSRGDLTVTIRGSRDLAILKMAIEEVTK